MAVVINEFEVVPATPAAQGSGGSGGDSAGQSGPSGQLTAHELAKLIRRQQERMARIRAY